MVDDPRPHIDVAVTFLTAAEGGRAGDPWDSPTYRPHLVVGDSRQRKARTGEHYLGVAFTGDGRTLPAGAEHAATLTLPYWPDVDYSALISGTTFTVHEGGRVVGWGRVVRGLVG
jgi:hypothetical protein